MKNFIFVLFAFFASAAFGAHEHTPDVCVEGAVKVCAHLGFEQKLNSSTEGQFKAHVMAANGAEVQNFKLDLWMEMGPGHGHGSSPVDVAPLARNMFKITNAWFVMPGEWQVRLFFTLDGQAYKIVIPVQIEE